MTFDPRQTYIQLLGVDRARRFRGGDGGGARPVTLIAIEYAVEEGHPDMDENIRVIGREWDPPGYGYLQHGTETAGLLGGDAGDGGIEGIAPGAALVFVAAHKGQVPWTQVLDLAGPGDVVSISLGDPYGSGGPINRHPVWNENIRRLVEKGADVFMAAGNGSVLVESSPERHGTVVGATTRMGDFPLGSSGYGPGVAYCAPGEGVWTTTSGGGYRYYGQTSAATPQVAGCKALLNAIGREYGKEPVMRGLLVTGRIAGKWREVGVLPDLDQSLRQMFGWPGHLDLDDDGKIGFGDFLAGIRQRRGSAAYRWLVDELAPNFGRRWGPP